jgi:hypothetical protein
LAIDPGAPPLGIASAKPRIKRTTPTHSMSRPYRAAVTTRRRLVTFRPERDGDLTGWLGREAERTCTARPASFTACAECGSSTSPEWMHDRRVCHGCSLRNHGVVCIDRRPTACARGSMHPLQPAAGAVDRSFLGTYCRQPTVTPDPHRTVGTGGCAALRVPGDGASPRPLARCVSVASRRERTEAPCPISAGDKLTRDCPVPPEVPRYRMPQIAIRCGPSARATCRAGEPS